ncbi:TspO/MBR family protein [Consotaella aegiceratis]|uniref:TspO/MBR family protein n=1 Tax=Consotaella aegiceratis TaxID=3097961 RepID=UPI002F42C08C
MNRWWSLIGFLALTLGGGWLIGSMTETAGWYQALAKPSFTPPDWLFPVAWTALYILIGIAGWRVREKRLADLLSLWWIQLALNFAWTPVFFVVHMIAPALVIICLLLGAAVAFVVMAWRHDRLAALCFVPYALWVAYAAVLNAAIWWLN